LSRISLAFKAFFGILFRDRLPDAVAKAFGLVKESDAKPAPVPKPAAPEIRTSDGALQMLAILQRDGRLIDFLMEDISGASDDQIGAAVRSLHEQCRASLSRYVTLRPVVDGVEGSATRVETKDPNLVKLLGNVPADGKVSRGVLRHKGWRADAVDLPKLTPSQNVTVLAPAEIEIE
jgi:hypothetical protein